MRKLLISLLLAGVAATPALADPDHPDHHWQDRSDHQSTRAERQERSTPAERPHFNAGNFSGGGNFNGGSGGGQPNFVRSERFQQNVHNVQQADAGAVEGPRGDRPRSHDGSSRSGWRNWQGRNDTAGDQTLRQNDRPLPDVMRRHDRSPMVSDIPRQGTQPPLRVDNHHRRDQVSWNRDWRHDGRYDWRRWRDRHRSSFHLGIYYDPFGWGYQPFSIGYRLWPNYYSSNYWINDPYEYRLPYAPPGTQWIRYYNDALLVDMYSGQVVDVIQNFFWLTPTAVDRRGVAA
jgi:Ni/Co efflux regulator RcnB